MKEFITLQLGNFGNSLGNMFWEDIYYEHNIDLQGEVDYTESLSYSKPEVFLTETPSGSLRPRAVLIDSNSESLNNYKENPYFSQLPSKNVVFGDKRHEKNYALGYNNKDLLNASLESIRTEIELCDTFGGFQCFHATGGGTGSGLMKNMINSFKEQYSDKEIITFSCFPSTDVSELPLEFMNSAMVMYSLIESADLVVCLDNEKIVQPLIKNSLFSGFENINTVMRQQVSDFTSFVRFPQTQLSSYYKISTFMVPFPRLHFLNITSSYQFREISDDCFTQTMRNENIFYQAGDRNFFGTFAAIGLARGPGADFRKDLMAWGCDNKSLFREWLTSSLIYHKLEANTEYNKLAYSYIQNSSNLEILFRRLGNEFSNVVREKRVEDYVKNGVDEMEMTEAESNLNDLVSEFQPWDCCCCAEPEYDEDDDSNELLF